jgi:hypothetical protein
MASIILCTHAQTLSTQPPEVAFRNLDTNVDASDPRAVGAHRGRGDNYAHAKRLSGIWWRSEHDNRYDGNVDMDLAAFKISQSHPS